MAAHCTYKYDPLLHPVSQAALPAFRNSSEVGDCDRIGLDPTGDHGTLLNVID